MPQPVPHTHLVPVSAFSLSLWKTKVKTAFVVKTVITTYLQILADDSASCFQLPVFIAKSVLPKVEIYSFF